MRKWWWTLPVLAVLALAGYVVAGPWLAMNGIDRAIARQDAAALERYVDFPALRANLKAHLDGWLARRLDPALRAGPFAALAQQALGGVAAAGVDTLVTPAGLAAAIQGRTLWKRAGGDTVGGDSWSPTTPDRPLRQAHGRFESPSRFLARVPAGDGEAAFVFTRQGLRWRLTDIHLPASR